MRLQLIQQYRYTAVLLLFLFRIIMFKIARLFVYLNLLRKNHQFNSKSVFSLLRQLTTWHCSHLLLNAVLLCAVLPRGRDRSISPARQQTRSSSGVRRPGRDGQTDGQTVARMDGQTPDSCIDPAPHMRAIPIRGQV